MFCVDQSGADPFVAKFETNNSTSEYFYYYLYTLNGKEFTVTRTKKLEELSKAEVVFHFSGDQSPKEYCENLWAPEIHKMGDGNFYIYYAAGDGSIPTQRMQVLKGGKNVEDGFEYYGKLNLPDGQYSIDGTVLEVDEKYYFVWSGWEDEKTQIQNLYISEMETPYSMKTTPRILISRPTYEWETSNGKINEGPEQLNSPNGTTFIIYSATGSMSNNYALGQLELVDRKNVMNYNSWKKHLKPIFQRTESVWGPGHCSFTTSPSDREYWIIYHSARCNGCGWDRWVNMQEYKFDEQNYYPILGKPINPHVNTTCPV